MLVVHPIGMMRAEHGPRRGARQAQRSDQRCHAPQGACNTRRALYAGIAQLNDDLINHIHLENNVLFPQFEASSKGRGLRYVSM